MNEILVQSLKTIEKVPYYVLDKQEAYKEVFEKWRKENNLVEVVINGRTSFSIEVNDLYRHFDNGKLLLPTYIKDKEIVKERINELEQCVGKMNIDDNTRNLLLNPTSGVLLASAACYGASKVISSVSTGEDILLMSRRDFIKELTSVGAVLRLIIGGSFSDSYYKDWKDVKSNAKFLDDKIKEVYQNQ